MRTHKISTIAGRTMTILALAAGLTLAGCAEDAGQKQTFGTLLGAGLGAWAGSTIGHGNGNVVGAVAGGMLGAAVGSSIGKSMDDVDRMKMREAEQRAYAAPLNETIVWNNPNNGHSGTVTAVRDGRAQGGAYCREFQSVITVAGKQEKAYGTACQQPDGSWKIVQS